MWWARCGLVSTGIGILVSRACMVVADVPLNIVLGSMPIILFAVGSAYGSHPESMQCPCTGDRLSGGRPPTIEGTGPVVLTAGLTTAVGLLSFVADIEPLHFGVFTAIGIVAALVLSSHSYPRCW